MRGTIVLVAVAVSLTATACSSSDDGGKDEDAGKPAATASGCASLPTADPSAKLPAGFPSLGDQVLYEPSAQGSTSIVFGLLDEGDFVEVRDELVDKLKGAGYKIEGTDQESVEAEAEFSGKQEGTIKVQPYCTGYVTIRYKFNN